MDDEYKEAMHKFYEIYDFMKKMYHLQMHLSFRLGEDAHIEVHEWINDEKVQLLKVTAETSTHCLQVAAERLKGIWERRRNEGLQRNEIAG